jgi:hypothetical protein
MFSPGDEQKMGMITALISSRLKLDAKGMDGKKMIRKITDTLFTPLLSYQLRYTENKPHKWTVGKDDLKERLALCSNDDFTRLDMPAINANSSPEHRELHEWHDCRR